MPWEKFRRKTSTPAAMSSAMRSADDEEGPTVAMIFVARGIRYAAIFWIQTLFPVEAHRQAVYNAHQLTRLIKPLGADSKVNELAEENFFNLARMLAEV